MDYGNGARTEYTHFGSGAVKKISHFSTTGSDGAPTYMCTMDAFGNVLQTGDSYSGYMPDSAGTGGGYHLTTKEFDSDSGLYYFNARWYDPTTGRFLSTDPLSLPSRFGYCHSAPNCADPTGEKCMTFSWGMQQLPTLRGRFYRWSIWDLLFLNPDLILFASGVICPKDCPYQAGTPKFKWAYEGNALLPVRVAEADLPGGRCEDGYCETIIGYRKTMLVEKYRAWVELRCCETCEEAKEESKKGSNK